MLVREVFDLLQPLEASEVRCILDFYAEVVFEKENAKEWIGKLTEIFGEPRKRPGENPTQADLDLTKDFRGIRRDQTLFYLQNEQEQSAMIAMLWPWASSNITLIVAKVAEK